MCYKVQKVKNSRMLNDFLKLPFRIYKNDPHWVAPLKSEVKRILNANLNPYFKNSIMKLFNCYKNNKICARTALIINYTYHKKFGVKNAFFGFFESINDLHCVKHLFDEVEKYCRNYNIEIIEGPYNPNHYSELGLQINKFRIPPSFFQPHNPDYYCKLLLKLGFQVSTQIHTRKNDNINNYIKQHYGKHLPMEIDGYRIRSFDKKNVRSELEHLRDIFNDAFSSNWQFLPLSKEEYLFSAKYLNMVTLPDMIKFVEYQGQPIGAVHCVLDINPLLKNFYGKAGLIKYLQFLRQRKKIRTIIVFAVGIKKKYQRTPALRLLTNITALIAKKYDTLETSWTTKSNFSAIKAAEKLGLKQDKEFILLKKQLIYQ